MTVCIVEDHRLLRNSLREMIDSQHWMSCTGAFADADSFLRNYPQLMPDLIIMDLSLPGTSGIDAISAVRAMNTKAKILVLTAFNEDEKIFRALKAGADGYLLKKYSMDSLVDHLMDLQEGGAPMSPEIARRVITYFQHDPAKHSFEELTEKEKKVLELMVEGYLYKEIAAFQQVSINAIKKHVRNIYYKLHVRSRSEAVRKYFSG